MPHAHSHPELGRRAARLPLLALIASAGIGAPVAAQCGHDPSNPIQLLTHAAGCTLANGHSTGGSLSADGRFLVFVSEADDLIAGDTNGAYDVFVHDRDPDQNGQFDQFCGVNVRVSVDTTGAESTQGSGDPWWSPVISGDGSRAAFHTWASLDPTLDTNGTLPQPLDVYAHDPGSGQTILVSVDSTGVGGSSTSSNPSISHDGRYVAFISLSRLVPEDTDNVSDIYVRDLTSGQTILVTRGAGGGRPDGDSIEPSISANGRYLAFRSEATNLIVGGADALADIYLHDRDADQDGVFDEPGETTTRLVSVTSAGVEADARCDTPKVSDQGRHVVFYSASALTPEDGNTFNDVFVHDAATGETTLVSRTPGGQSGDHHSGNPEGIPGHLAQDGIAVSADGRFIGFQSRASNLVPTPGPTTMTPHVYVLDRDVDGDGIFDEAGSWTMTLASVDESGNHLTCWRPSLSDDGRQVSFATTSIGLLPCDTNDFGDVYARGLCSLGLPCNDSARAYCFCPETVAPCDNPEPTAGCLDRDGVGALLSAQGSASVTLDDLVLAAIQIPANQFGIFYMGSGEQVNPFGNGIQCITAGSTGIFRFPIQNSGASGVMTLGPGIASQSCGSFPPAGCIVPGSTWKFQAWHRDAGGRCGETFNFSNAVSVAFGS